MKHFFPLTSHFFGLTLEYKKHLLEEVYVCMRHFKLPYHDIMKMPTYERRFFMVTLQNELTDAQEKADEGSSTTSTGKGTRTTKYSGTAAKSWAQSNKTPNEN